VATAAGTEEPGEELTVGELAARVDIAVRHVRAYAARGLLPPPRLMGRTAPEVTELVEQAAEVCVGMFHSTVWKDFLDAGAPEADRPRLQEVVERMQPVAAQALLASFRSAMAAAVAQELEEIVGQLSGEP